MSAAAEQPIDFQRSYGRELAGLGALFRLTLRQHTHGRRLYVVALLYLLPCVLAIILRSLRQSPPLGALEIALVFNLLPHGLAPLTALLYSAAIVQDEVEEQTVTYLLLRPLPRWGLYVTKLLATFCTTAILVACSAAALYVAIYWGTPELGSEILPMRLPRTVGILVLGQAAYCALFGFLGLLTRRSLIAGVIYIVAVEGFLASLDFVLRNITVVYYLRILTVRWLDLPVETLRRLQADWSLELEKAPTANECVLRLIAFSVVLTALTAVWFSRREFHVKTPEGG